jgi:hypothetical protein
VVFSLVDDSDTTIPKYAQCNNCGIVHKVYDLCKSEIISGKDETRAIKSIEDIGFSIPSDLCDLLNTYNCDLATWEQVKHSLDYKIFGENIILTKELVDTEVTGKVLVIKAKDMFSIESYIEETSTGEK